MWGKISIIKDLFIFFWVIDEFFIKVCNLRLFFFK